MYNIVELKEIVDEKHLNSSLVIPSAAHTKSICIEFIRSWFLSKWGETFFKTIYLNGENILNSIVNKDETKQLKALNPALAINCEMNQNFDRDKVDMLLNGVDMYMKRSNFEDSFYKDLSTDTYLGMTMKVSLFNFAFRLKFSTSAQQLDMYDYIMMNFRVGATQCFDVSMDYHIPYELMSLMAKDAGFELDKNGQIINIISFLEHLNKNSVCPIVYKYRCMTGHNEFYLRYPECRVHINIPDMSKDSGTRKGQIETDFCIDLNMVVRFPAPKFFVYFTEKKHMENIILESIENAIPVFTTKVTPIPVVDEHNWNRLLMTDIEEKDKSKPLEIDFRELFDKDTDIYKTIQYNNSISISSSVFMNFKLFNDGEEIEYDMDWSTITLTTKKPVIEDITHIGVYIDTNYTSMVKINLEGIYESRLK